MDPKVVSNNGIKSCSTEWISFWVEKKISIRNQKKEKKVRLDLIAETKRTDSSRIKDKRKDFDAIEKHRTGFDQTLTLKE